MVARLKVRYLLYHAVLRENKKTTKCSVVFDASAYDERDVSLDECKYTLSGSALQPNLVSDLFDSEHVMSQLWLMLRRCSSRSKLTKETRKLQDIYGGI